MHIDKFSALMTSSEAGDDVDVSRDQIRRLLGRTRDTEPPRDSKSRVGVNIRLSDVVVVDVVTNKKLLQVVTVGLLVARDRYNIT